MYTCTAGRISAAGLEFFDKGLQCAGRGHRRAGQAAGQRYLLAQIVTEIHAPDLAVGDV